MTSIDDPTTSDPKPNPHATAEEVEAALTDTKLAQVLYHDWEAETYDEKWSISFDERCIDYARGRLDRIVPDADLPYERAMELGCGTGFFLLNLVQSGVATKGSVTDLSPGMVKVALRNAEGLGLDVDGRVADAEKIPYDDDTFDLVVGHAVLHHIPDVEQALREVLRVLKPGGRFVFAGEPSTLGDFYARWMSRATWWATTNITKFGPLQSWRRPQEELDESSRAAALEAVVDIHTFSPQDLEELATAAGAVDVASASEELAAAMLGWPVRTFEAAVPAEKLGWGWARFAFGGWKRMTWLDDNVLQKVVPPQFFYNVLITGCKPAPEAPAS
ncbi:class I SAM-dependent methyltransferase [Gordonia iterans]